MEDIIWVIRKHDKSKELFVGFVCIILLLIMTACESKTLVFTPTTEEGVVVVPVQQTGKIIVNNAVLRAGPGVDYDQIGTLTNGENVEVIGKTTRGDWLKIIVDGFSKDEEIWVSSDFVTILQDVVSTDANTDVLTDLETPSYTDTAAAYPIPDIPTYTFTAAVSKTPTATNTAVPATLKTPEIPTITSTAKPKPPDTPTIEPTATAVPLTLEPSDPPIYTPTMKPPDTPTYTVQPYPSQTAVSP